MDTILKKHFLRITNSQNFSFIQLFLALSPVIITLFSLFWVLVNSLTGYGVLYGSLYSFFERIVSQVNLGLLPYRDYFFEYPPYFYLLLLLLTSGSFIFRSVGEDSSFYATQFFLAISVALSFYLSLVPKKMFIKTLLLVFLMIPLLSSSLDYFAVLACIASLLLALKNRGLLSVLVLSLGVGIKVYPIIYFPILLFLLAPSVKKLFIYTCTFLVSIVLPYLYVYLFGGFKGIKEFLAFHLQRGLEYESVLAVPYYLKSIFLGRFDMWGRANGSIEISYGHNIDALISFLGLVVGTVVFVYLLKVLWCSGRILVNSRELVFGFALALTLVVIVFGKVLSQQYLTWYLLLLPFANSKLIRKIYWQSVFVILATLLEVALVFSSPIHNQHVFFVSIILIARNAFLVYITIRLLIELRQLAKVSLEDPKFSSIY